MPKLQKSLPAPQHLALIQSIKIDAIFKGFFNQLIK